MQIGSGDPRCHLDISYANDLLQSCPNENSVCITEFTAEWQSRGNQLHRIRRFCQKDEDIQPQKCTSIDSGAETNLQIKTCQVTCRNEKDQAGCNGQKETEKLYDLFSTGKVSQCSYCHYSEHLDGDIPNGDMYCKGGTSITRKCKKYEDSGCYTAANWHQEKGKELEEDVRGCSSFVENEVHKGCSRILLGAGSQWGEGAEYEICKDWCDSDNCNNKVIEKPHRCHQCSVFVDQFNKPVGNGRYDCFENPRDDFLVECPNETQCFTELIVDWSQKGELLSMMRRGCGTMFDEPADGECREIGQSGDLQQWNFKECKSLCNVSGCNDDTESDKVISLMSKNKVKKCHNCWSKRINGEVSDGSEKCWENGDEMITCPKHLDAACASSVAMHSPTLTEEIFKGCAAFSLSEESICYEFDINNQEGEVSDHVQVCKETCSDGDGCNQGTKYPNSGSVRFLISFAIASILLYINV